MEPKATLFEFTSYSFKPLERRILFNYKTEFANQPAMFFTETIILPKVPSYQGVPKEAIDAVLQGLHIILGISYYKFYCATKVALPYNLSKQEADFWNTVYQKGLGEFFYKNNLDPNKSPVFPFSKAKKNNSYLLKNYDTGLVGIGGGKDSIVAAELLKTGSVKPTAFHVETNKPSKLVNEVVELLGLGELKIQRILDAKVRVPHQYNGHIPISAIYAFLGIFSAISYHYSYVVVGNEHSSNFGNTVYKGLEINHQWSKSLEFETLFQKYVQENISPNVTYFSLLRSFYELRIVEMFSKHKKYFAHFSSCNRNFSTTNPIKEGEWPASNAKRSFAGWCCQCAKCVFAFLMLSAFLPKKDLLNIFGKNLYEDEALLPLFKDVLGFGDMKPFDCIGTFEEAQTALFLAKKKFAATFIMRQLGARAKLSPEVFATTKNRVPELFKFLAVKNVLIAGMGKEGQISKQYIKKEYPTLKIGTADAKQGSDYLKKQEHFDIAVKTPGIPKELITIPHTTATNIFFSKVIGKNIIIGVTGSKGKSTTSSLIYHILKSAGKDVQLLGNIGTPMLGALLKPIPKNRIFVLELSSYQLDDIAFSPNIAVVTNLFPEHMDFHHGLENYYAAKKNIINFQHQNNFFVYNPKNPETKRWLKNYNGNAVPFSKTLPLPNNKIPLIGQHNADNIKAAISVARLLNITEEVIAESIASFKPLPHRLENIGTFKGVTFYDDAISTSPESTIMAIEALNNIHPDKFAKGDVLRKVKRFNRVDTIFLGGQDRGYDFTQLEKTIKKYNIKNLVLFPENGNRIIKEKTGLNILKTNSMKEAVKFAYAHTKKGSICLLSCASPSYSLWKNFEHKGDEFKKIVKKMGIKKRSE